jgi:oligoendopeptidase F
MDKNIVVARLKELKAELARIDEKLAALDDLLDDGLTDEAVKAYADALRAILDEREPIINEARELVLLSYREDLDSDGTVN